MPVKSTVRTLPPEIREVVDRLLKGGRHTLDQIIEHLRQLDVGVSRSALGRYAQSYAEELAALREVQEVARGFAQELGDLGSDDASRYLVQMVQAVATKMVRPQLTGEGPSMDSQDLMFMARAIKDLVGSTKISAELEMKIREDAKRQERERLAAELKDLEKSQEKTGSGPSKEAWREILKRVGYKL